MGKINFIDLGTHQGEEIEMFLSEVNDEKVDFEIYSFEASPSTFKKVNSKYKSNPNVTIFNYAIANKKGKVRIYQASKSNGNSIFKTKNNVNPNKFYEVNSISIVDWIKENIPSYQEDTNILRFNIEGAELLLMRDIVEKDFREHISLFLGARVGADILKCSEIKGEYGSYVKLLKENNIKIHFYCECPSKSIKIFDHLKIK